MRHAAQLANSSHIETAVDGKRHTDVNCPPFNIFRVIQLVWMEYLPSDLAAHINRTTKSPTSSGILTERSFCGLMLLLSTLPVDGSMTSLSVNWMYKRTVSPSRGMTMADPFVEWIAVRFRMSGKFVSSIMSTTPQTYSGQVGQKQRSRAQDWTDYQFARLPYRFLESF